MTEDLGQALVALNEQVQTLLTTLQQLVLNLEAARRGKAQAETRALSLSMALARVRAELEDDTRWMTDLASHKIAVELSLQTQQAVQNALAADAPARQAVEYYKALEQVAERATMLLSAGAERSSALRDLSDALETWRSLREKEI